MSQTESNKNNLPDDEPVEAGMKPLLDPNVYATKKTVAQGMLDVALLTSNASQLKFLLQKGRENDFYVLMVTLISLSIILQVLTGCIFVLVGYTNFNHQSTQVRLNLLNNIATISVFLITMINILVAGFGLSGPS